VIQIVASLVATGVGAGIVYGVFRQRVVSLERRCRNMKTTLDQVTGANDIGEPTPFILRRECDERIQETVAESKDQKSRLMRVEKFVRWYLATKERLSLAETEAILNGE